MYHVLFLSFLKFQHWTFYPVSGQHLRPVLVDDLDDSWWLDPSLAVHLDRDALLPQNGDLHLTTLFKHSRKAKGSLQM